MRRSAGPQPGYIQTNGLFDDDQEFLPAVITASSRERANIQQVVSDLERKGYLQLDYAGKSNQEIYRSGKRQAALSAPVTLPYYELVQTGKYLEVYGGVNQIGTVATRPGEDGGSFTSSRSNGAVPPVPGIRGNY